MKDGSPWKKPLTAQQVWSAFIGVGAFLAPIVLLTFFRENLVVNFLLGGAVQIFVYYIIVVAAATVFDGRSKQGATAAQREKDGSTN